MKEFEPYRNLVVFLVRSAMNDLLYGNAKQKREAFEFFQSDWFEVLVGCSSQDFFREWQYRNQATYLRAFKALSKIKKQ